MTKESQSQHSPVKESTTSPDTKKHLAIALGAILVIALLLAGFIAFHGHSRTGLQDAKKDCTQYTVTHTGDKALDDHKYTTIKVTEDGSGLDANTRPSMSPKLTRCIADKTGMTDAVLKRIDLAGIDYDSIGEADWNSYHAEWQRIPVDGAPLRAAIVKLHIERV